MEGITNEEVRKCRVCTKVMPIGEFRLVRQQGRTPFRQTKCRKCECEFSKAYARRNHVYRDKQATSSRKHWYDITDDAYDAILQAQGGVCAICEEAPTGKLLALDHCHTSGRVRGLLCSRCNLALGHFGDSLSLLVRAAAYIEYHNRGGEDSDNCRSKEPMSKFRRPFQDTDA